MTIAPALLLLVLHPQELDCERVQALKTWKPCPKVAAEIAHLEREAHSRYRAFLDGKLTQWTVIRENARTRITIAAVQRWACENPCADPPQFVVLETRSEGYWPVFPRGRNHVPRELVPGQTYRATPDGRREWHYIGTRTITGITFAIFQSKSSPPTESG